MVGPLEAVGSYYGRYADFSGESSRSEYWWVALYFAFLGLLFATLVSVIAAASSSNGEGAATLVIVLFAVLFLIHVVPTIAITLRRLHDAGLSGWWWFVHFVPGVGGIILLVLMLLPTAGYSPRRDRYTGPYGLPGPASSYTPGYQTYPAPPPGSHSPQPYGLPPHTPSHDPYDID